MGARISRRVGPRPAALRVADTQRQRLLGKGWSSSDDAAQPRRQCAVLDGRDVVLRNSDIRHCAAAVAILGTDNIKPSQRANHILIDGNRFTDIDPKKYTATTAAGSNKVFEIDAGPAFVTISNNTVAGANVGSGLYLYGTPPAESFTFVGNTLPKARYGLVFGDVVGLKAWAMYTINGILLGNVEQ
jgi:hypothetical protein